MAFVKFIPATRYARLDCPRAKVYKNNIICLNTHAFDRWLELRDHGRKVDLYFDAETGRIGLEISDKGAFRLRPRKRMAGISAASFIQTYQLEGRAFTVDREPDGMFVLTPEPIPPNS